VNDRSATIVVDLAFGDCGKGSIVDFLTREQRDRDRDSRPPLVVRFNGGPQAGHNVVTPRGRHHTFAQFGSGTFVPGVVTLLARFMLIEPYAMINEAAHLRALGAADALHRLFVDENCIVITPPQQAANRLRELARRGDAHGTCGLGIGEAMADSIERPELVLRAGQLRDRPLVRSKLRAVRDLKVEQLRDAISTLGTMPRARQAIETLLDPDWIDVAVDNYAGLAEQITLVTDQTARDWIRYWGNVIFEGAQGVLLDEKHGFHPHTTWSTTTFANADTLLDEADFPGERKRLGVLRSYFTRHGPGPFLTEDAALLAKLPAEPHNNASGWQGAFRVGAFDAAAARYALSVAGHVDGLALTHLDRVGSLPPQICTAYELDGNVIRQSPQRLEELRRCRPIYTPIDTRDPESFIESLERELNVRVSLTSHGPAAADKRRRIVRS
jgi:adenylosuccinate synthase